MHVKIEILKKIQLFASTIYKKNKSKTRLRLSIYEFTKAKH